MNIRDRIILKLEEAKEKEISFNHKGSTVKLVDRKDHFQLTGLHSENRGKGHAHIVMRQALSHADKHKKMVKLNAIPDDDTDAERLKNFYRKHGFKDTHAWNGMTRETK